LKFFMIIRNLILLFITIHYKLDHLKTNLNGIEHMKENDSSVIYTVIEYTVSE